MRIKNKSWSPLVVSLPGGRSLTLAGRGTDEINAEDFESPEVQRLAQARTIIVLPEEKSKPADAPEDSGRPAARREPGQPAADASTEGAPAEESH